MGGFTIFMIVLGGGSTSAPTVNYMLCVCEAQIYAPGADDVDVYRPGADEIQVGCEC